MKLVELHTEYAIVFLNTQNFKYDLIECKCLCCKKKMSIRFWWKSKGTIFKYIQVF